MVDKAATAALAYALYDSESTGRLGEDPNAEAEYFRRASRLLYMIQQYQTDAAKTAIAQAILRR